MNDAKKEHPAAKACATLHSHIDVIGASIRHNHGAIEFSPENESLIKRLNKAGLGYIETDTDAYILHSTVVKFVSHFEKKGRMRNSSKEIHTCFEEINHCTETYLFAKHKYLPEASHYLSQISELIVELSSLLHENCLHFSSMVADHLAVISDLELKIHMTEQALKQHGELRETVLQLSVDWLDQMACLSKVIERLVKRRLQPVVNACNSELLNTAHQIKAQITALKKEQSTQHRNLLIDSVHRYLNERQIGMQLDLGIGPTVFNRVAALTLTGYANINQYAQLDLLGSLAAKAAENRHAKPTPKLAEVEATINLTDQFEEIEPSPLQTALEYFFEAALQSDLGTAWRGVDCYHTLQPDVDLEFWLMSLVDYHHINQKSHASQLNMRMQEIQAPNFNGNFLVHDVVFIKSRKVA